ncbi:MAG: thioredoxin-related protein [Cyclobacteriaceae bacterium]|jgi:thioredoxin-related protein
MYKIFFSILIVGVGLLSSSFQVRTNEPTAELQWLTMEEALKLNEKEPRKILVDMYTDWCGWCKRMDIEVYANPGIVEYLNANYYNVKFNTEKYKENIEYAGKTFKYIPAPQGGRNGIHELAYLLMNKKASYPTTVFIDEALQPIQSIPGYQKVDFFEIVITYIGEDKYKDTPWAEYQTSYSRNISQ